MANKKTNPELYRHVNAWAKFMTGLRADEDLVLEKLAGIARDAASNGLPLNPGHHKQFDRGMWTIFVKDGKIFPRFYNPDEKDRSSINGSMAGCAVIRKPNIQSWLKNPAVQKQFASLGKPRRRSDEKMTDKMTSLALSHAPFYLEFLDAQTAPVPPENVPILPTRGGTLELTLVERERRPLALDLSNSPSLLTCARIRSVVSHVIWPMRGS